MRFLTHELVVVLVTLIWTLMCVTVSCTSDDTGARLLVAKQIHNKYLVEGKDILVEYTIYNVGSSAALKVQLTDSSFPEETFEVVRGLLSVHLDRLAPSTNISHSVVLRPKVPGYLNFSAAEIRYLPLETAKEEQIGFSSEPGQGEVASFRDFDRKFSPHFLDWTAFAIMTLPSLGIPFLLWFKSKSRYTVSSSSKQSSKKN